MKKLASTFIFCTALVYTYLFFHQLPGINYLMFDVLLISLLCILQKDNMLRISVIVTGCGMLLSALFIFLNNTVAALILHWISFGLFVRYFYEPQLSPYLAFGEQVYISILSTFRLLKWRKLAIASNPKNGISWAVYLLTIPVVGIFVLLYSSGNELYRQMVSKVFEMDVDFSVFFFFLSGLVLAFSVFAPFSSGLWKAFDIMCPNKLEKGQEIGTSPLFGTISSELKGGVFMLAMLNVVTLSLHITDIYSFLVPAKALINHSENVHQGVNGLIISILLAILIVVYFFRAELNFLSENTLLKGLTYAWLTQNIGLVLTTCYKDFLYISDHGLTHKRIGVVVWLAIVLFGIIYTFIKIENKRSVWYLLRINTWTVYAILLLYSSAHWDRWIVRYNTSCMDCQIDYAYFRQLDLSAFADLKELEGSFNKKIPLESFGSQNKMLREFSAEYKSLSWPSFNLESERILNLLNSNQSNKTALIR